MRCSHCSSGRVKRAENFGADRMQCGSCGTITKQAHHPITGKQQEFIDYVGRWNSERLESGREGPNALTQIGIAEALGMHRSNINRLVQPLIDQGLVRQKRCHITNEEGRVISGRHPKSIYYLTPEGRQHITVKTGGLPLPGYRAETFESETIVAILETADDELLIEVANYFGVPVVDANMDELFDDILVAIDTSPTAYVAQLEMMLEDETFASETFRASRSDLRRRRRTPFYKIERPEAEEDRDVNRYARTNAGGALWEATYQALRDEGRSHAQAEAFCNSKFFDHYYEALIEGLRRPMRKVLKDIRRANRKAGRDFDKKYLIDEFIFDNQVFNAHEGGHFEDIHYESDTYPLRPTRPSGPWPTPTPRPRRPNRRPNPRPRPARRPFQVIP